MDKIEQAKRNERQKILRWKISNVTGKYPRNYLQWFMNKLELDKIAVLWN